MQAGPVRATCKYLIAADGAASPVRRQLGIHMHVRHSLCPAPLSGTACWVLCLWQAIACQAGMHSLASPGIQAPLNHLELPLQGPEAL